MRRISIILSLLFAGCPAPLDPDSGVELDAGIDGSVTLCARDSDCGDTDLFCSRFRCRIGEPGADASGCIDLGPPCDSGLCDEDLDRCGAPSWCTEGRDGCISPGDCDGDGHLHTLECGGDDCEDTDPDRFPGNAEICDSTGHDEDCNPDTFAGPSDGDLDGDGFVASTCCNGEACGDDCDDDDINVNPGAAETCNGEDDDCDGSVDEAGALPLCPGGVCEGSRCNLMAWDRTMGGDQGDWYSHVDMDAAGNVFVGGRFQGEVRVGSQTFVEGDGKGLVVSYSPSGVVRWIRQFRTSPSDMVVTSSGDVMVGYADDADVVRLDGGDGTTIWRVGDPQVLYGVELAATPDDGVITIAAGNRAGEVFAGLTLTGDGEYAVAKLDADGNGVWVQEYGDEVGSDSRIAFEDADASANVFVVAGYYQHGVDLGDGIVREALGFSEYYALGFSTTDGELLWAHSYPNPDSGAWSSATAVAVYGGNVILGGWYSPSIRINDTITRTVTTGGELFLLTLAEDGTYVSDATTGSSDNAAVRGLAIESNGNLVIVGDFTGEIYLGSGYQPSSRGGVGLSGFMVRLASDGTHLGDIVFSAEEDADAMVTCQAVAVGPANSTAIVGHFRGSARFAGSPKVSQGEIDGFVYRLAR